MSRRILNGWKEISSHMQRSVRTAQRWEAQMGMPVHRPAAKDRGAVVAFSDELEKWLRRSPAETQQTPGEQSLARLFADVSNLVADAAELASRVCMLQEQMRPLLPRSHRCSPARQRLSRRPPGRLLQFPAPAPGAEIAR
jgi:phage terminase Nu1 subunit (DNA packaging protein)